MCCHIRSACNDIYARLLIACIHTHITAAHEACVSICAPTNCAHTYSYHVIHSHGLPYARVQRPRVAPIFGGSELGSRHDQFSSGGRCGYRGTRNVVAVCCNVLPCCSVLQCVVVCCSVLQCVLWDWVTANLVVVRMSRYTECCCSMLQYVAVCCSMLQCAAVCCSVLQCVLWDRMSR